MPRFYEGYADELVVPEGSRDVLVFDTEVCAALAFASSPAAKPLTSLSIRSPAKSSEGVTVPGRTRRITLEPVKRNRLEKVRDMAREVKK